MLKRMSLSAEVATEVTAAAGQNLFNDDDFLQLNNKDIETLCRVICWPDRVNVAGNVNQGISVLAMAKANLKCMIYQLCHVIRCSRPIVYLQACSTGRDGGVPQGPRDSPTHQHQELAQEL
jgi:hypothetical protein